MNPWRATCGGCGWPILWAWHRTVSGQQCRNCQLKLAPAPAPVGRVEVERDTTEAGAMVMSW